MSLSARITLAFAIVCSVTTPALGGYAWRAARDSGGRAVTRQSSQAARYCELDAVPGVSDQTRDAAGTFISSSWQAADMGDFLHSDPQWLLATPGLPSAETEDPTPQSAANYHLVASQSDPAAPTTDDSQPIEATVTELFRPLQSVRIEGPSSIPPRLPAEASVNSLQQPADLAGHYMEDSVPAFYYTRGYGIRRPPRNTWAFCCNPLYFEEVNLERCGQSKCCCCCGCCTTACSAVHFVSRAAILPYLLTLQHHDECVRTLPDCPTCHEFGCEATCPAWCWKAAIVQGAAVTGLIYAIP